MAANKEKIRDAVKEVVFFVLATAGAFAYILLIQLIVSFVALSYVQMNIETMLTVAAVGAVLFDVYYIIRRIKRHK